MAIKKTEADAAIEAAAKEVKDEAVKKAPAKRTTAAKKTTTTKRSTAAKKTAENIVIQQGGAEISTAELVEKAKAESGVKAPKSVNIYVKPEENMVYYVVDDEKGSFSLC
ncbi:MAG: DUF6465 family protein [Ruminococcus sp.]|nr:DUF6465 family protein [Ruminococcus sp.]